MMLERGESGRSVRLTLKIVQSGHEPLAIVYPGEGMEVVMGKHAEVRILRSYKNPTSKLLAAF
jgi:hypothetical protein